MSIVWSGQVMILASFIIFQLIKIAETTCNGDANAYTYMTGCKCNPGYGGSIGSCTSKKGITVDDYAHLLFDLVQNQVFFRYLVALVALTFHISFNVSLGVVSTLQNRWTALVTVLDAKTKVNECYNHQSSISLLYWFCSLSIWQCQMQHLLMSSIYYACNCLPGGSSKWANQT